MASLDLDSGVALLEKRFRIVRTLLIIGWVVALFLIAGNVGERSGAINLEDPDSSLTAAYSSLLVGALLLLIGTIVVFCMWIYRAADNLVAAGVASFTYTPKWAVGWYFVPFANLFKPFAAMRQIWNGSHGGYTSIDESNSLLTGWWIVWLISNILGNIAGRLSFSADTSAEYATALNFELVSHVFDVALYPLALILITRITAAQVRMRLTGGVFA